MFGQVGTGGSYGRASTTGIDSANQYRNINGSMGYMHDDRSNPVQYTVAYISCHDNYNVADHIETCGITGPAALKASSLGHATVLTSQGISFMQEGEEFLRTKELNENSSNASYQVNDLDYSYKVTYNSMYQNFKKLVSLKTSGAITVPLSEISAQRNTIAYDQSNYSYFKYEIGDYIIMHQNGNGTKINMSGYTGYTVYLDTLGYMSGTITTAFDLNPYQTVIHKKNS
jgi:pullulanase